MPPTQPALRAEIPSGVERDSGESPRPKVSEGPHRSLRRLPLVAGPLGLRAGRRALVRVVGAYRWTCWSSAIRGGETVTVFRAAAQWLAWAVRRGSRRTRSR